MKEFRIVWKSLWGDQQDQVVARTENLKKADEFFETFKDTAFNLSTNLFRVSTVKGFYKMVEQGKAETVKSAINLTLVMVTDGKVTEIDFDDRVYIDQENWDE